MRRTSCMFVNRCFFKLKVRKVIFFLFTRQWYIYSFTLVSQSASCRPGKTSRITSPWQPKQLQRPLSSERAYFSLLIMPFLSDQTALPHVPVCVFRREREKTGFSFHLESEWAGGQRVDKAGKGLLQVWKRQIQQFNRVSPDMASAILAAYPSPQLLRKVQTIMRSAFLLIRYNVTLSR